MVRKLIVGSLCCLPLVLFADQGGNELDLINKAMHRVEEAMKMEGYAPCPEPLTDEIRFADDVPDGYCYRIVYQISQKSGEQKNINFSLSFTRLAGGANGIGFVRFQRYVLPDDGEASKALDSQFFLKELNQPDSIVRYSGDGPKVVAVQRGKNGLPLWYGTYFGSNDYRPGLMVTEINGAYVLVKELGDFESGGETCEDWEMRFAGAEDYVFDKVCYRWKQELVLPDGDIRSSLPLNMPEIISKYTIEVERIGEREVFVVDESSLEFDGKSLRYVLPEAVTSRRHGMNERVELENKKILAKLPNPVLSYFESLGRKDVESAIKFVTPAKRNKGIFEIAKLKALHENLRSPIRVTNSDAQDINNYYYFVDFTFEKDDGFVCDGFAEITTEPIDGAEYISTLEETCDGRPEYVQ
jgi:hypothetical protein